MLLLVFRGPLTKNSTGAFASADDCKFFELPIFSSTMQELAQVVQQCRDPQAIEMQVKANVGRAVAELML